MDRDCRFLILVVVAFQKCSLKKHCIFRADLSYFLKECFLTLFGCLFLLHEVPYWLNHTRYNNWDQNDWNHTFFGHILSLWWIQEQLFFYENEKCKLIEVTLNPVLTAILLLKYSISALFHILNFKNKFSLWLEVFWCTWSTSTY